MIQYTTFVIDVLRGDDDAEALLSILESESLPGKVSAVTVLELQEGVARANTPDNKRREVLDVLESKHVVEADATVMRIDGRLFGSLITRGPESEEKSPQIKIVSLGSSLLI